MAKTRSKRGSIVGLAFAQTWRSGSDGYPYGTAGEGNIAAGATSHALLLKNPRDAQLPAPSRVKVALKGGNRWLGQVLFGPDEIGDFKLTTADLDADFHALSGNSVVDDTSNTRHYEVSDNPDLVDLPSMGLLLSTIYQDREDGGDSENLWINYVVPRCQIAPSFPALTYKGEAVVEYTVSPTYASRKPNGVLFSAGHMALKNNRALMYAIISPKPLALTMIIADGVETDYVLGFRPSSSIITLNQAAVEASKNGTLTALASASTTTGTVALPAVGTSGDKWPVMYETDFDAVA